MQHLIIYADVIDGLKYMVCEGSDSHTVYSTSSFANDASKVIKELNEKFNLDSITVYGNKNYIVPFKQIFEQDTKKPVTLTFSR